jgi:son of sevenless-like protein
MAILAALNSAPIHRLKRTMDLLSAKTKVVFESLKVLMDSRQNFLAYRSELRSLNPPCVPFLGTLPYREAALIMKDSEN